jgi:hypothetical protein
VDFYMDPEGAFKFMSVKGTIKGWFKRKEVQELAADVLERWKANYTVTDVEADETVGHEQMMGHKSRFVEALKR